MAPLYSCMTCGFLSTLPSSYSVREGVRVCKTCALAIDRGDKQVCKWLAEKRST